MDRISAYVYDESNVYNEAWARRLDIELNIRDNQATALEVAMYVRGEFAEDKQPLTDAQVTAAGIAREGKIGSIGYRIGRNACESVMDALRNKVIEDSDALAIADFCPGNERVQGKGLKVIMEGGSKTEARARMEAELAKQKMAREVGVEGGTDLFGNALEDEAFWDFVAKYVVGRRNELAKDALFLRTNVGKRNSSTMTKKYGVDLKDPESLKKALKEIDMLRERWKNPYVEADLMEEIKRAWQERQEGEGKPAAQVFERYAQRLREGEKGVTDYSARGEKEDGEEEKKYRVENDTTGLERFLNDKVKPIEINFDSKNAPDSGKSWLDDFKEFYSKVLAGKELVIRRTGNKLYFHDSSDARNVASKGARSQKRNETGKKMEEVVVEAYHLYQGTPEHRENEGNHRKKMVNASDEFHVFGHPATVNGEKMMVCFTAIHRKDEEDPKRLRFYEFGTPSVMQKKDGEPNVKDRLSYHPATPSEDTLADYLKNVNSDFEGKPKIVEEKLSDGGDLTISQAQERGMFKDGVMEVSNGVIVDRRTDYSVIGAQTASPHLYREPDLEKVGTGEGNQSQGWGLYWSTRWSANAFYHRQFSTAGDPIKPGSREERILRLLGESLNVEELNLDNLSDLRDAFENFGWERMSNELREVLENKGVSEEDLDFFSEVVNNIEIFFSDEEQGLLYISKPRVWAEIETHIGRERITIRINPEGKYAVGYMADLDVDDSNVLHWDEPASRLFDEHPSIHHDYMMEGCDYYGNEKGKDIYYRLEKKLGSDKAASQWLDARGIRGNKYLDGMSRRHEEAEKMYNYVIFNENYIKITRINNRHPWSEYSEGNPDWQRPEEIFGEGEGVTDYSVAGMKARTAGANMDRVYRDPADGKEKFVIPTANARLSTGFTLGQLKAPVGGHKDVTLGAVLEYPELYEAYPELKGMRVRLYNPRLQEGVGGFFARPKGERAGYLALNTGVEVTPERVMETLLHESQHAIQAIEGHAMGAGSMNAEEALEYLDRAIAARKGIMKAAGDDAWSRENLAYLEAMRGMVQGKEGKKMQEMAIEQVYWYSPCLPVPRKLLRPLPLRHPLQLPQIRRPHLHRLPYRPLKRHSRLPLPVQLIHQPPPAPPQRMPRQCLQPPPSLPLPPLHHLPRTVHPPLQTLRQLAEPRHPPHRQQRLRRAHQQLPYTPRLLRRLLPHPRRVVLIHPRLPQSLHNLAHHLPPRHPLIRLRLLPAKPVHPHPHPQRLIRRRRPLHTHPPPIPKRTIKRHLPLQLPPLLLILRLPQPRLQPAQLRLQLLLAHPQRLPHLPHLPVPLSIHLTPHQLPILPLHLHPPQQILHPQHHLPLRILPQLLRHPPHHPPHHIPHLPIRPLLRKPLRIRMQPLPRRIRRQLLFHPLNRSRQLHPPRRRQLTQHLQLPHIRLH